MALTKSLSTTTLNSFLLPPRVGGITAAYASLTTFTVDSVSGLHVGDRFRAIGGPDRYGTISDITGLIVTAENVVDSSGNPQSMNTLMTKVYAGYSSDVDSPINSVQVITSKATAKKLKVRAGHTLIVLGTDGGEFYGVTGAAAATYADDGGSYCGTKFIPTGGNGSSAWLRNHVGVITDRQFGTVGDGIADDTVAIRNAFKAWAVSATGAKKDRVKLRILPGEYKLTSTIDLSTMFLAQTYYGLDLDMDAGAVFVQASALSPMLYFATAEGGGFSFCNFKFGQLGGGALGGTGIVFRNTSDSTIHIQAANAYKAAGNGVAIHFNCGGLAGIYNNIITIGAMLSNQIGILAQDIGTPPHGFQGNLIKIGHPGFNVTAIWLLNQSTSNSFEFGALEGNTGRGVLDQAGYNIYRVNFASDDIIELGTANGRIDVQGYGFVVSNTGAAKGMVVDNKTAVIPIIPALPASTALFVNSYARPATVAIAGGTVTAIIIDGFTVGLTSGSFRVPYGSIISITYSVAPSWVWTFE